jgi:clorobiocin biosynthesis protein CloN3
MDMDFNLTPTQQDRYDRVLANTSQRLAAPTDDGSVRDRWAIAADLGLTGLCLPVEQGGGGLGALDTALCLQALGRGCPDTGFAFGVAAHLLACAVPIRDFAEEPIRSELLRGMASGACIAANAMTEQQAGSDLSQLATVADRDGEDYVLDGEKSFVSNGPIADVFLVYAVTDPSAGYLGTTAFAVPAGLPGLTVSEPLSKMGLRGCLAGTLRLDGCRLPARYRIGAEGQGGVIFQHSMTWERACLFAIYLGVMAEQLDQCVAHARKRRQFGRPIGQFQAVSHRIVRMRQRYEAARLLLWQACWQLDAGRSDNLSVALSKLTVSEAAIANSLDAVQLFGASGYLAGGPEEQLRDSLPSTIFSGTSEIQAEMAAREMGLL